MAKLNRTTLSESGEPSQLHLEENGNLALTGSASEKKTGLSRFFASLIEAHRYVQNRRSASMWN